MLATLIILLVVSGVIYLLAVLGDSKTPTRHRLGQLEFIEWTGTDYYVEPTYWIPVNIGDIMTRGHFEYKVKHYEARRNMNQDMSGAGHLILKPLFEVDKNGKPLC